MITVPAYINTIIDTPVIQYLLHERPIFLAFGLALMVIIGIFFLIKRLTRAKYFAYKADVIYDLPWRWNWKKNTICNLWCYCPKCHQALVYDDTNHNAISDLTKTDFICEHCDSQIMASIKGGNKQFVINLVQWEIRKKIQTGTYQSALLKT
ncbi:hypothetical protein [Sulfurospirillum sp. 1612]|uniref:hypothetical protein n=1 Tax=Sulfurospirillum sp. 1612 TaxID=3094835 RepID=UPI002F948364